MDRWGENACCHLFPFFHPPSLLPGHPWKLGRHFSSPGTCPGDGNYKCSWGGQWQHSSDIISRCYCALLLFWLASSRAAPKFAGAMSGIQNGIDRPRVEWTFRCLNLRRFWYRRRNSSGVVGSTTQPCGIENGGQIISRETQRLLHFSGE